ncbi:MULTISPECIES: CMD domain protein [unclassified Xanthobacter]|uniref:CMD domain protein n=1 Tax=unclassified Xanthobacter TaxID=2623496 RepID=UPI001F37657A|nr:MULTISPECIES: CMD domain protein [unclassified Xanthobacter]
MYARQNGDVIESVLGLTPSSPIPELRGLRPMLKHLSQTSYAAALEPEEPCNFSRAERAALAARMAAAWRCEELATHYRARMVAEGGGEAEAALADPAWSPPAPAGRLAAVLRHADLVTLKPKSATRADIEALKASGLDERDIVALSGLIAFVNYQIVLVAGLRLLRDH